MARPSKIKIAVGDRFGELTALEGCDNYKWKFMCSCGNEHVANMYRVTSGDTVSCGCVRRRRCGETHRTHGMSDTPEYWTWTTMIARCHNPNSMNFLDYGARGIIVCDRWRNSFENFIADMGTRPIGEYSIDRINSEGNYEPFNCRWATKTAQSRNRKVCFGKSVRDEVRKLRADGMSHKAIAERVGMSETAAARISTEDENDTAYYAE